MKAWVGLFILTSAVANAQILERVEEKVSDTLDGASRVWGVGKTAVINAPIKIYNGVFGDSCGDVTFATYDTIERTCPTQLRAAAHLPTEAVEDVMFDAGARDMIQDESCEITKYGVMASDDAKAKNARKVFITDLQQKLKDLRPRWQAMMELQGRIDEGKALLQDGGEGAGAAPANVEQWLKTVPKLMKELGKETLAFNDLLGTSPLAYFPEGQAYIRSLIEKGGDPSDEKIKAVYAKAVHSVSRDQAHLRDHLATGGLSRTDKLFLLEHRSEADWFKGGASPQEVHKVMCRVKRNYKTGEKIVNGVLAGLSWGSWVLVPPAALAELGVLGEVAVAGIRAREATMSFETAEFLSWSFAAASGVNQTVDRCRIPRAAVGKHGPRCSIDPDNDVMELENRNCALGLLIAARAVGFTAATSAIGRNALARAEAAAEQKMQPVLRPYRAAKGVIKTKLKRPDQ